MVILDERERYRRARALRLVVTDVDGVLTDATVYYSARGEELLRFSRRDGMGIELLARAGIRTAIVSREDSAIVRARANKLGLSLVFLGIRDKGEFLSTLEREADVPRDAMAYIGDDVVDLEIMRAVALAAAPSDAIEEARAFAHYITPAHGGHGAFRDFSNWILRQREVEQ
jgi:3-deoxy-D-manno-octulosonate 8-phosphate phosphatase (KDO 8-P phosphatase)